MSNPDANPPFSAQPEEMGANNSNLPSMESAASCVPLTPSLLARQATCDHDWEFDGQTLMAVRWTCSKCLKTEMR